MSKTLLKLSKWLGLVVLCALAVGVASLVVMWSEPGTISVCAVRQKTNITGQIQIAYVVTNGTSRPVELYLGRLETLHEKTGWWRTDASTTWHLEQSAGQVLGSGAGVHVNPMSAAELEIRPSWRVPRYLGEQPGFEGSAIRGELLYFKVESPSLGRARAIGRRLGLPRRWMMSSVRGQPLELPAVDLGLVSITSKSSSPPVSASPTKRAPSASPPSEDTLPAGAIKFRQVELRTVLDIFADLADAQLEIDPRVRTLPARVDFENSAPLTRSEAVRMLEQALQEQAGIVVKHLDETTLSVTASAKIDQFIPLKR